MPSGCPVDSKSRIAEYRLDYRMVCVCSPTRAPYTSPALWWETGGEFVVDRWLG